MIRYAARIDPHRSQLLPPGYRGRLILKRAHRLPALYARVADQHRLLLGDATLQKAQDRHLTSVRLGCVLTDPEGDRAGWTSVRQQAPGPYGGGIDDELHRPRRSARELARAVQDGRHVGAALRHLDVHSSEPGAHGVANALARFLVARCDSHHAGWRVVRQVVVDSAADAPWEKCARRAVPVVAEDLITLAGDRGRTQLAHAQHIAAQRRAEQIGVHVDQAAVLTDLGLRCSAATLERWRVALSCAVRARSREQVARAVDRSLRG